MASACGLIQPSCPCLCAHEVCKSLHNGVLMLRREWPEIAIAQFLFFLPQVLGLPFSAVNY